MSSGIKLGIKGISVLGDSSSQHTADTKFSYFCKYDELPRIVACPGVQMPSLEKSLYDPNLKQKLRELYLKNA